MIINTLQIHTYDTYILWNTGLKVGRMTQTIWVTWVTFLVGLICKLNYLDTTWTGYHMFFRQQCWHMVSEWTLGLLNALKHHWCETSLLLFLKYVISKDFIFKKYEQGTSFVSCQKWRNLGHCSISKIFMSCYITFKKKTSTCGSQVGHMWVTSRLFCGSVGQIGQQVWPTFNPGGIAGTYGTAGTAGTSGTGGTSGTAGTIGTASDER